MSIELYAVVPFLILLFADMPVYATMDHYTH